MKQEDIKIMFNYLKAYYPNWDINLNDNFIMGIWFEFLQEIPSEEVGNIVKKYCLSHRFPPTSPTDILEVIPRLIPVKEAVEIIWEAYRQNKGIEFVRKDLSKNHPELYKFARDFINGAELDSFENQSIGYSVIRPFRKAYQAYLDSVVHYENEKIITNNIKPALESNKPKELTYDNNGNNLSGG